MGHLGLAVHVVVLDPGLHTGYLWTPGRSQPAHFSLCPSPPIFFTALFPLLSTDVSAKCFPPLLAIFIPLSELFPSVNSFLAQGGQLSPGASLHHVGRRCGVDGHLKRGKNWQRGVMPGLWELLSVLTAAGSSSSSNNSKMLIHSPFQFAKTILCKGSVCRSNQRQAPKIALKSAAFCFASGFSSLQGEERKDPEHLLRPDTHLFYKKTNDSYSCY